MASGARKQGGRGGSKAAGGSSKRKPAKASPARSGGRKGGGAAVAGASFSLSEEDTRLLGETAGQAGLGEDHGSIFGALERFGMSSDRVERLRKSLDDLDAGEAVQKASDYLNEQIEHARDYAKANAGRVIGGAAGVLVGASLLAMAVRRAMGDDDAPSRSRGSKKSSAKKGGTSSKKKSSSSKKSSSKPAKKRSR